MTKEDVKKDIIRHIAICGQDPSKWCLGISENEDFVFENHNVIKNSDMWIVRSLDSNQIAKEVKDYLIAKLKIIDCKDETGDLIFAYLKNNHTNP